MASVPPSSLPPGGIPSGGNGKYIAAVLLLLLLVGGLVVWKLGQKDPQPVVTVVEAGPPPKAPHPDEDDIPPPPPIEDASVEDTGAKKPVQSGNSLGCDAPKCKGSLSSDLETAIAFRGKQAHRCYDNALAGDPNLQGKMTIALKIGASGAVCGASVASNDLGSPAVAQCVANYYRNGSFPAPKGGCSVELNVPLNFVKR